MYVVQKTIRGRRYWYRQRTYREGAKVKTESVYLGPVDGGDASAGNASPRRRRAVGGAAPADDKGIEWAMAIVQKLTGRTIAEQEAAQNLAPAEPVSMNSIIKAPELPGMVPGAVPGATPADPSATATAGTSAAPDGHGTAAGESSGTDSGQDEAGADAGGAGGGDGQGGGAGDGGAGV